MALINKFTQYEHLIWDWNGTIINDVELNLRLMNKQLADRNLPPLTAKRHQRIFGFPLYDFYVRLGFDLNNESFDATSYEFMSEYERHKKECSLHEESLFLLQAWHGQGKKQSILSAYPQAWLEESLVHYNIIDLFTFIYGSDDHHGKGKHDKGKELLVDIGLPVEKVAMIGDTVHDFEVAQGLGIDCFLVTGGNQTMERLQQTNATIIEFASMRHIQHA